MFACFNLWSKRFKYVSSFFYLSMFLFKLFMIILLSLFSSLLIYVYLYVISLFSFYYLCCSVRSNISCVIQRLFFLCVLGDRFPMVVDVIMSMTTPHIMLTLFPVSIVLFKFPRRISCTGWSFNSVKFILCRRLFD